MHFDWSPDQIAFRDTVRRFLDAELPDNWVQIARKSPGSRELTDFSRQFCPKLANAGLLVPHWPERWGGRDAPAWEHFLLGEVLWEAGEPRGPQYYNVNWIGPTVMEFGSEAQQELHLPLMSQGNVVWCQGFSEPSAGSDLASLSTTARRVDGGYEITGSKIWTSYASLADYCFLLARIEGMERGITVFLLPMDRAGIDVRPIPSVVGEGDLHEVFFDSVRIEDDEILGGPGRGWDVARYALNYERIGIPRYAMATRILDRVVGHLKRRDAFTDLARDGAAAAHAQCEAARMLTYSVIDKRARGLPPDHRTSVARYATVAAENAVGNFVLDYVPDLMGNQADPIVETHHRRAIAAGIASGAAEIQLNLVARHVLGLGE